MSYVLHVWEEPKASTVDEAIAILFDRPRHDTSDNPKFVEFVQALTQVCPDDEVEGGEESVWSDSPLDGKVVGPVLTLGVRSFAIDDVLFGFIADSAADLGLHVFDMQAACLYRPDRQRVLKNGTTTPTPRWSKASLGKLSSKTTGLSHEVVRPYLKNRFLDEFAREGWQFHEPTPPIYRWGFSRQNGEVVQVLEITCDDHGDSYWISIRFGFSTDRFIEAMAEMLPEKASEFQEVRERRGGDWSDLKGNVYELFGPKEKDACSFPCYGTHPDPAFRREMLRSAVCAKLASWDELEKWFDRFLAWFDSTAIPALTATKDVAGLNGLFDTPWMHEELRSRNRLVAAELCAILVVPYLAGSPTLVTWFETVVSNLRRQNDAHFTEKATLFELMTMIASRRIGLPERLKAMFVEAYTPFLPEIRTAVAQKDENRLFYYVRDLVCTVGLKEAKPLHEQAALLLKQHFNGRDCFSVGLAVASALETTLKSFRAH